MTFEEARAHLGVETQRQWSGPAIARTTPVLLGLYSLVTLWAVRWHGEGTLVAESAAWYAKGEPTFSDALGSVRRRIWRSRIKAESDVATESLRLSRPLLEALIHGLSRAA